MKKISFDLDLSDVKKIEKLAKENFRSFGAQLRYIIKNYKE